MVHINHENYKHKKKKIGGINYKATKSYGTCGFRAERQLQVVSKGGNLNSFQITSDRCWPA